MIICELLMVFIYALYYLDVLGGLALGFKGILNKSKLSF